MIKSIFKWLAFGCVGVTAFLTVGMKLNTMYYEHEYNYTAYKWNNPSEGFSVDNPFAPGAYVGVLKRSGYVARVSYAKDGKTLDVNIFWPVDECKIGKEFDTGQKYSDGNPKKLACVGDHLLYGVQYNLTDKFSRNITLKENLGGYTASIGPWDLHTIAVESERYYTASSLK
ncbi:hypothetical protein ABXV23_25755 [Vibrio owensii]|uniref:hypothetical protein n=1 Tax=Vibrio owensii TaxID=696485 RepID=UPI003392F0E0